MKRIAALLSMVLLASVMQAVATGLLTKQQAERDALKAVGGGTVTLAVKEKEAGKLIWSVDINGTSNEFEVWVDAHTGAILKIITQPLSPSKFVSKQQAERIALKAVGGGTVVLAQRDQWKGYQIWDVTITQPGLDIDVYVEAHSGAVLKIIKQRNGASASLMSKKQAEQIALNAVGGGTVQNANLDDYKGRRIWDVDITQPGWEFTVYVDAHSGRVLNIQKQQS